jgi:hypothetical protein
MKRAHNDKGFGSRLARVIGMLAAAGAGIFAFTQIDSLRRYIGIRRMSASKHPTPPGTIEPGAPAPPRWGTSHWPVH